MPMEPWPDVTETVAGLLKGINQARQLFQLYENRGALILSNDSLPRSLLSNLPLVGVLATGP